MIEQLPPLTPDAIRRAKVVARCHQRLAQQRRRLEQRKRGSLERNVLAALAVLYFVAVAGQALSVFTAL